MGLDITGLLALADLHQYFGDFGKTVQIGRQGIYVASRHHDLADEAIRRCNIGDSLNEVVGNDTWMDEHLLPRLGASPIVAADASPYEGATIVHDFNEPIPAEYHGQFDTLIEFGSLEHIFNVPVALANMMKMVRVGGRILNLGPTNNWLGHGFYQLGPELPFRVFRPENGFRLLSVKLVGMEGDSTELSDLGAQGTRNEIMITPTPTHLISIAEKISDVEPFRRWPQQGDYELTWEASASAQAGT